MKREGRERLAAGKLLITLAARRLPVRPPGPVRSGLLPSQSVSQSVLPHWRQQPIPFPCSPPQLAGRGLARHRDPGCVRVRVRRRRRRVSLRRHNLWGQSAIRFSLTLLLLQRRCTESGADRKKISSRFSALSLLSLYARTEGMGRLRSRQSGGMGVVGSTKLVCPILWPNKMIF